MNIANKENDEETIKDCNNKIEEIQKTLENCEKICFLSGENDDFDIYLEIHAGAGGTESQDWADMLRRMYLRWFDKKKYKYEVISEHKGDEAGIKSSIIKVDGDYLYGLMRAESQVFTDWLGYHHLTVVREDIQVLQVFGFILL